MAQTRILIAENDYDAADKLAAALRRAGHEVVVAYDGAQAVHLAVAHKPHVCVVDLDLPVRDGLTVARMVRRHFGSDLPKLIALNGHDAPADRARTSGAGFDDHLAEPASVDKLVATVTAWIGGATA